MKKSIVALFVVSLVFIIWNILHASTNLLPWIDEVMFADTSVNFALNGVWKTTAWYAGGDQYPFSTYPPIYQFLLAAWIKIFGFSLLVCRSLNYFISFGLLMSIYLFLRKLKMLNKILQVMLFGVLFWIAGMFSDIYREGRPDILTALIAFFVIVNSYSFVYEKRNKFLLIFSSMLLILTGFQAVAFVVGVYIFFWLSCREYRKYICNSFIYFCLGSSAGLLLLVAFMWANGHLFAFLTANIAYSATLKNLSVALLPYIGPLIGLDVDVWLAKADDLAKGDGFLYRILHNYIINAEYLVLLATAIVILLVENRVRNKKSIVNILCGLSLFIPLFMGISGRFADYYTWMSFLPALIGFVLLFDSSLKRVSRLIASVPVLWILCTGLIPKTWENDNSYRNLQQFVEELPVQKQDVVVSPFSAFYDIRIKSDSCYFLGIYPEKYMVSTAKYIITTSEDDYGREELDNYLEKMQNDSSITILLIRECVNPRLKAYEIKKLF